MNTGVRQGRGRECAYHAVDLVRAAEDIYSFTLVPGVAHRVWQTHSVDVRVVKGDKPVFRLDNLGFPGCVLNCSVGMVEVLFLALSVGTSRARPAGTL